MAVVGLALEARVPEGGEIVRNVLRGVGGMDFPVSGERRLGIGIV